MVDFFENYEGPAEISLDDIFEDDCVAGPTASVSVEKYLHNSPEVKSYYDDYEAWSNSMMNDLEENEIVADLKHRGFIKNTSDDKYAIGQYLHNYMAKLYDPTYEFECKFLILDKIDKRTKEYKDAIADVNLDEVYVIDRATTNKIELLCKSFYNSVEAKELIVNNVEVEVGFKVSYSNIESEVNHSLKIKGKADMLFVDGNGERCIIDWKTNARYSRFAFDAKYSYARPAFMYSRMADASRFIFVVFDSVSLDRWKFVEVDINGSMMEIGRGKLAAGMRKAYAYHVGGVNHRDFKYEKIN